MGYTLETPPAVEPLTAAEVRAHAREDQTTQDTLIESYIVAARLLFERRTSRQLTTATWALTLDAFPSAVISLERNPVQSVTSIAYTDSVGDAQTLDAAKYVLDATREPARITLAYGQNWPDTYSQAAAVVVTFAAGYGDAASDIPEDIRVALRQMCTLWYNLAREAVAFKPATVLPACFASIIHDYRPKRFA